MPRHAQEGLPPLPDGAIFIGDETDKVGESPTAAIVSLLPASDGDVLTGVGGKWESSPASGGGLTFGTVVERVNESGMAAALAAGDNIAAADPTKARFVQVRLSNLTGSSKSPFITESIDGNLRDVFPIPNAGAGTLTLLLAPGEEFWVSASGCDVDSFVERAIS